MPRPVNDSVHPGCHDGRCYCFCHFAINYTVTVIVSIDQIFRDGNEFFPKCKLCQAHQHRMACRSPTGVQYIHVLHIQRQLCTSRVQLFLVIRNTCYRHFAAPMRVVNIGSINGPYFRRSFMQANLPRNSSTHIRRQSNTAHEHVINCELLVAFRMFSLVGVAAADVHVVCAVS